MTSRRTLVHASLPGYPPEVGAALWRLEDARARTMRTLAPLRDEHLEVQVHGNSAATILYHLALIEADWLYSEILTEPIPSDVASLLPADDRDADGILTVVRGQTLAEHLERLGEIRARVLDRMRSVDAEDFHRARALPDYDVTPAWVLHHLAQHEAEHRSEVGAVIAALRAAREG